MKTLRFFLPLALILTPFSLLHAQADLESQRVMDEVRELLENEGVEIQPQLSLKDRVEAAVRAAQALDEAGIPGNPIRVIEPLQDQDGSPIVEQLGQLNLKKLQEDAGAVVLIDEGKKQVEVRIPLKNQDPTAIPAGNLWGINRGTLVHGAALGSNVGGEAYISLLEKRVQELTEENRKLTQMNATANKLLTKALEAWKAHSCSSDTTTTENE